MGRYCKLILIFFLIGQAWAEDESWQISFYCPCEKCNGRWLGVTAMGYVLDDGVVACNSLPLGTIIHVEGVGYKVIMDRGAERYFGTKDNPIKHIDVYISDHNKAKQLGVQYKRVKIIRKGW